MIKSIFMMSIDDSIVNRVLSDSFFALPGLCLDSLRGRLVLRSHLSNYSTRNQLGLDIPRLNLEFLKNNFFYSGVKT